MLVCQETATPRSEMLAAALDALAAGVVLTASDGQVVYMNAAAAQQIETGGVIRVFNNRLSPVDPAAAHALRAALVESSDDRRKSAEGGNTLALPNRDGSGILVTILPLARDDKQGVSEQITAIFIQDPNVRPQCPGEAFAKLYGLTGGELRVALALMRGLTPQQVASVLLISLETVKTHLKRIFQKTDTCRQAELLTLMSRASGLVRAA